MVPPRLLLGVALLFWGAVIGKPLLGLLCALLVEARWWTDLRWSFGERGYVRAWTLTIALLALGATWVWFLGEGRLHLFDVFMWMPVCLLPMILAQQFGTSARIPLNTFSFIARRRVQLDREAGRPVRTIRVHFGYAYFGAVVMASAVVRAGPRASEFVERWWFFGGVLLLAAAALFFVSPLAWKRPVSWVLAFALVTVASLGVSGGLLALYAILQSQSFGRPGAGSLTNSIPTRIGTVGEIKLSDEIYWRAKGEVPKLLRETVFNRYRAGVWAHLPPTGLNRYDDFEEAVLGTTGEDGKQFAFRREDLRPGDGPLSVVTLRGAANQLTPLPLPAATRVLERVQADGVSFNSLGTVRADNPDYAVLDFSAHYGDVGHFEQPPTERDLNVFPGEAAAVARVCDALGLRGSTDRAKMQAVRNHFLRNFRYSLYAGAGDNPAAPRDISRAIGRFLETTRSGHCEYFATAAVLLLREAGVPARYCIGYAARQEFDERRQEWVLRGRHAHAWCRAYIDGRPSQVTLPDETVVTRWSGGRWVDLDATPPTWTAIEADRIPWQRRVLDWFQRLREDFLLWRTRPGNISRVSWAIGGIGTLVLVYVAARLWFSRKRTGAGRRPPRRAMPDRDVRTPLHALARPAERWLGPRPEGLAQTRWLMQLAAHRPELEADLRRAVHLHWKARFDPLGLEDADRKLLHDACRDLRRRIRRRIRRRPA